MMTAATYDHVLKLARRLALAEQLELLQALLAEIRTDVSDEMQTVHSILELKGLGREIWQEVDVEEYLQQERNSWVG